MSSWPAPQPPPSDDVEDNPKEPVEKAARTSAEMTLQAKLGKLGASAKFPGLLVSNVGFGFEV